MENVFKIPTNPANTNVLWLSTLQGGQPRLFAVSEAGQPVEMQTSTLESYAEQSFSNKVENVRSFYSAHYAIDPFNTSVIFNHGLIIGNTPRLNLFKTDAFGRLLEQRAIQLPYECFIHDSTLSKSYVCYVVNPYLVEPRDKLKFLFGKSPYCKLYRVDEGKCSYVNIHLKQDLSLQWSIPLPNKMAVYHLVDAFEDEEPGEYNGEGKTIVRLRVAELDSDREKLEWQFSNQYFVPLGSRVFSKLTEYAFRLEQDGNYSVLDVGQHFAPDADPFEFPLVNKQFVPDLRHQYCWTNAKKHSDGDCMNAIQKIDMKAGSVLNSWIPGPARFACPPTFCARCSSTLIEDDGYLVAFVYDSNMHSSSVVILDASDLSLLCEMELDFFVPYQFHGAFQPAFLANTMEC